MLLRERRGNEGVDVRESGGRRYRRTNGGSYRRDSYLRTIYLATIVATAHRHPSLDPSVYCRTTATAIIITTVTHPPPLISHRHRTSHIRTDCPPHATATTARDGQSSPRHRLGLTAAAYYLAGSIAGRQAGHVRSGTAHDARQHRRRQQRAVLVRGG